MPNKGSPQKNEKCYCFQQIRVFPFLEPKQLSRTKDINIPCKVRMQRIQEYRNIPKAESVTVRTGRKTSKQKIGLRHSIKSKRKTTNQEINQRKSQKPNQ